MFFGIGEAAALGTAFGWAVSSQVHGAVGRIVGVSGVTLLRPPFQIVMLSTMCLVMGAVPTYSPEMFTYLLFSALFGLVLGDFALYQAIVVLGAHMGLLLQSLCASITAILGVLFLGEHLSMQAIGGIALTTLGVIYVVTDKNGCTGSRTHELPTGKKLAVNVFLGIVSAACLACSFIFLKKGMPEGTSPLWATYVRLWFGAIMLWGTGLFFGWSSHAVRGIRENRIVFWILLGSSTFSAAGLWLSGVALNNIPAGIAATLFALQPVLALLVSSLWHRRLPSLRAVIGTLIAFSGTAVLCLR